MMQEFLLKIGRKTLWTILLENLTKSMAHDLENLKEVLTTCWEQIRQDLMNRAIDQWLDRILLVIRAKGNRIEHCFLTILSVSLVCHTK